MPDVPSHWQRFAQARYGMFIHWGAYSAIGRGEQSLFRDRLDPREYAQMACAWQPERFDAAEWAAVAKEGGINYAVLTTRHHDGFCLWDSQFTDYTTVAQAAGRDFVREYCDAFRAAGLRVGLYYSLADWRIPAYWEGPANDPEGWGTFRTYVHNQVRELLTHYGKIDVIWFDGAWPRSAMEWGALELIDIIRTCQPEILINNRLGSVDAEDLITAKPGVASLDGGAGPGESGSLGDFGTPEHHIIADRNRLWESCQVSTWRLWGYTNGERWRPADLLLDMLVEAAGKGGNLLMNVGPQPDGQMPPEFVERSRAIGQWLDMHGECIYGSEPGDVCEFITYGHQIRKGNNLYLIVRFWDGRETMSVAGLATPVRRATLLTTGQELEYEQSADRLLLRGLPAEPPTELFPVVKLEFDERPEPCDWARARLWGGDPRRMTAWAASRGFSVRADGK
ncbi:alpha-L-fucosidase [bacterium]|nr:alpha-L-fucosidase [bacterium]